MGMEAVGLGKGVLGGFVMLGVLRCSETAAANTRKPTARNDLVARDAIQWWSALGRVVGMKSRGVFEVLIFFPFLLLQILS